MALLTREQIQQHIPFEMVEVDVSELDSSQERAAGERTTVFVREMNARERDAYEASLTLGEGKNAKVDYTNFRAKLAAATCCDADGNLIFLPEDVEWLAQKPAHVINRIFDVARKLNGITDDTEEETVKN